MEGPLRQYLFVHHPGDMLGTQEGTAFISKVFTYSQIHGRICLLKLLAKRGLLVLSIIFHAFAISFHYYTIVNCCLWLYIQKKEFPHKENSENSNAGSHWGPRYIVVPVLVIENLLYRQDFWKWIVGQMPSICWQLKELNWDKRNHKPFSVLSSWQSQTWQLGFF
jgi:hypothetical protein